MISWVLSVILVSLVGVLLLFFLNIFRGEILF